jgi:hypothetical protein
MARALPGPLLAEFHELQKRNFYASINPFSAFNLPGSLRAG